MHSEVTTATVVSVLTHLCLVRSTRHEPRKLANGLFPFPKGSCARHESCSQLRQYRLHPVHAMDLAPFRSRPCAGPKLRLIIRPQPKTSTTGGGFPTWRIEERRCTTHTCPRRCPWDSPCEVDGLRPTLHLLMPCASHPNDHCSKLKRSLQVDHLALFQSVQRGQKA